jgi:CHAP domain
MNTPTDVLDIAKSQIGTAESGSNQIKYWDEIGRHDLQGNPWCACFVTWVMKKAGVPFPTIDTPAGYVYCPDAVSFGRAHGELTDSPQPGDIALFDWERDSISDHTGIVVSVSRTMVSTIDGNVDNRVVQTTRPRSNVLAFFHPPYGSAMPSGSVPVSVQTDPPIIWLTWLARRRTMIDSVPTGGIIVARPDGAVDCFDGAQFYGNMIGKKMNSPVVGIAATPSGKGYWLLGEDGGVFTFGDAQWNGPDLLYYKRWGVGLGTQSPLIGIRRGASNLEYTIVSDSPSDTQARLYHITADGQYKKAPV